MHRRRRPVEYVELDQERKWDYLRRFYKAASAFYDLKDRVINDSEVQECVLHFKEKPAPETRKQLDLREWKFTFDNDGQGVSKQYYSHEFEEKEWQIVRLPHSICHVPPDPVLYGTSQYHIHAPKQGQKWKIWKGEFAVWYKTRVAIDGIPTDKIAYIDFDSVNLLTDVWVNENPVMIQHLGLFPFQIEVTEELNWRQSSSAVIAVKVSNYATSMPEMFYNGFQSAYTGGVFNQEAIPTDSKDQCWSGIAGDVRLLILSRNHMVNVFIFTEEIAGGEAFLKCRVELRNTSWRRFTGTVSLEISKWFPKAETTLDRISKRVVILPMNETRSDIEFVIESPQLWNIDTPNLYLAHVVLLDDGGAAIDDMYESFGVRTIKIRGSHFYLNNRKLFPRGSHDVSNYHGESLICPSDRAIVTDILLHKRMNANCSRWPSDMRMHYGRIAEYADQLGFMVFWAGYFETWQVHPEMEVFAQRDAKAMVRGLRNHPSIILWEMGDEPLWDVHHYRRFRWYEQIYALVKQEDESRPIIPGGMYANELVELVLNHPNKELTLANRREEILEDYPVFRQQLSPWDYHYCPFLFNLPNDNVTPTYKIVDLAAEMLGGRRPTIFTEFGIDGMPRLDNVLNVYGKLRWESCGNMPFDRKTQDIMYYGQTVSEDDWRETQAAQALVLCGIIGRLRENPRTFAAFSFITLVDAWTYYNGVVDANFNTKLAYFAVKSCYGALYISALHGTTVVQRTDCLDITASNFEDSLSGVRIEVRVRNSLNRVVKEMSFSDLELPGNGTLKEVGELDISGMPCELCSIELTAWSGEGGPISRNMELCYVEHAS